MRTPTAHLVQQCKVESLDQVCVRHVTAQVLAVLVRQLAAQVALQGGWGRWQAAAGMRSTATRVQGAWVGSNQQQLQWT